MGNSDFDSLRADGSLAQNAFYQMAFRRLRAIASGLLLRERRGHTLQPTALVSEAFLRLRHLTAPILDEEHFFRIAASAMRQVLIDSARAKIAVKRIPPQMVAELLPEAQGTTIDPELSLAAKLTLERLRRVDRTAAEAVWLRSVEGLTLQEVSQCQDREVWRVRADYDFGLKWMAAQLTRQARTRSAANSSDHGPASRGLRSGSAA